MEIKKIVGEETFPVTKDIGNLFYKHKLALKNRDRAIKICRSAKMAIRFLKLSEMYRNKAWDKIYKLYPEFSSTADRKVYEKHIPELKLFRDNAFTGGVIHYSDENVIRLYVNVEIKEEEKKPDLIMECSK